MLITIVICTYNRSEILKITLPCYLDLDIPKNDELEVIIVDNNSQDETKEVIAEFIELNKSKIDFKYAFESRQGLSYARNHGYERSSGNYIAYIDDECILPRQWLDVVMQNIYSEAPAFLGGPYYGKYLPRSSSNWYRESFGDSYILQYRLADGPMKGHFLSGGNLVIRSDVFDKVGLFDTELGMNGETISYGEEQDFQKRLVAKWPSEIILYSSKVFVWHCIRDEKMSILYAFKEALVRGEYSVKKEENFLVLFISPVLLFYFSFKMLLSGLYKFIQSVFVEEHFFTLLYKDYVGGIWRGVGASWCRTKRLIAKFGR